MDLFGETIPIRDHAALRAEAIGIPAIRGLIVCHRQGAVTTYVEIEPKPHIVFASPRLSEQYGENRKSQVELDDIQVSGISKKYAESEIVGRGISYLIDAVLDDDGKPVGGIEADKVPGLDLNDEGGTWAITLRRRKP